MLVIILLFGILGALFSNPIDKDAEDFAPDKFMLYTEFESRWIIRKGSKTQRGSGYKYDDGAGCYVIVIHSAPVNDGNYLKYDDVYVGQSVHVYQRVHDHFTGKGKGDVFADIKYGKYAYVQIIRCEKEKMNQLEKKLIGMFNATDSYNYTKGGGKRR